MESDNQVTKSTTVSNVEVDESGFVLSPFTGWLFGFIGGGLMLFGIILIVVGVFAGAQVLVLGVVLTAGGSFMRYMSKQTVSVSNPSSVSAQVAVATSSLSVPPPGLHDQRTADGLKLNQAIQKTTKTFNPEEQDLANDAFKLYLVEKYGIYRHEVFGKFVVGEKMYDTLDETLAIAKEIYAKETVKREIY